MILWYALIFNKLHIKLNTKSKFPPTSPLTIIRKIQGNRAKPTNYTKTN